MSRRLERFFLGDTTSSHLDPRQFDWRHAELLEIAESRVFRVNEVWVLKIYDTPLSQGIITLSTLKRYRELTSRVSNELASRSDVLTVSEKSIPISWKVIEIDDLGEWPGSKDAWSISQFIPGTNLRDIYYPHWARRQVLPPTVLKGQLEQMLSLVDQVSLEVNARLGTCLTDIDLTNVIADVSNAGFILNVTDICGIVSKVDGGHTRVPVMFGETL